MYMMERKKPTSPNNDYIKSNLTDQANEESLAQEVSKILKNIPVKEF